MRTIRLTRLAALAMAASLAVACGGDASTDDATTTTAASDATTTSAAGDTGRPPAGGPGGGGGETDPSTITTEAALVTMIGGSAACGDGSLDLHRGHQPIESTLEDLLGITHDEMHVRMEEKSQNLAAVADDVGLGAAKLETSLVAHFMPAIDGLEKAGTITAEKADDYRTQLEEAIDFRVNWDGKQAPLELCTAST